uniref:Uncharacterized protein n=1 Tax=Arundo donax TaxID=35708 RepID=A0A0A9C6H0_ARUDO
MKAPMGRNYFIPKCRCRIMLTYKFVETYGHMRDIKKGQGGQKCINACTGSSVSALVLTNVL